MRIEKLEKGRRRARDARLVLSGLLALSLIANLSLSLSLVNRKNMTVLVPAVAGPAWEVGNSWAGKRYLEDTARTAAVTLLTLTPENANYVREAASRMSHASARGAIGAWLSAEAERMGRRDLSTAFYPHRVAVDPEALTAEVQGKLATWIGREEASREDRRYRLVFGMDGGRIGLLRFEEIDD